MRKRTRPRVVWFPKDEGSTLGNNSNIIAVQQSVSGGAVDSGRQISLVPVIINFPAQPAGGLDTLSDVENSGYRLRRLCGKVFCGIQESTDTDEANVWLCSAAFIVLRVDSVGVPVDTTLQSYDLYDLTNDDSPWIWRREWILSNGLTGSVGPGATTYPVSNVEYGSASDGPHLDQKTARVISQNERLFFVTTVTNLGVGSGQATTVINWFVTPRVLGSMRPTSGNRRNASR